jgi:hypothetical protein
MYGSESIWSCVHVLYICVLYIHHYVCTEFLFYSCMYVCTVCMYVCALLESNMFHFHLRKLENEAEALKMVSAALPPNDWEIQVDGGCSGYSHIHKLILF